MSENEVSLAEMHAAHGCGVSYPFCGYRTISRGTGPGGCDMESICIEPVGHNPAHVAPMVTEGEG